MNPQTKAEFDKLLSKPANKTCIDCDAFNPQWASVNNGCFMCIKCAGNHRSMGVHITFVRSVTMDSWSKIQLARMKNGGNHKLKQFWLQQKFPKNLTPKQRLDNTAMDKYREHLLAKAKGESVDDIPIIGYQAREISSKSSSNLLSHEHRMANSSTSSLPAALSNSYASGGSRPKMQGFGNTDYNPHDNNNGNDDDGWGDFWNSTSSFASSFAAKTSAAAADFAQKSKVAASSLGQKASEKAGTLKNKLGDEEYQANLKKNAAETWSKTTSTLSSWWSTAATSVTNVINENLGDGQTQPESTKLYHEDQGVPHQRKKMAALSSDQYFHSDAQQQQQQQQSSSSRGNSYGSATNTNTNGNANMNNAAKEEDILGMNSNASSTKKQHINNVPAPFPEKKKNGKVSQLSDDFEDDWGFGSDDDNNDKPQKTQKKQALKQPMTMEDILDDDENATQTQQQKQGKQPKNDQKKVESLLDFDNDAVDKGKSGNTEKDDGNSSDDLDAFFNEMEKEDDNEENDKVQNKNKDDKQVNDLLTDNNDNKKSADDDNFDWGF